MRRPDRRAAAFRSPVVAVRGATAYDAAESEMGYGRTITMALNGGCLCGAVRYEVTEAPTGAITCCCRDCQKAGGGLFHYGVIVPRGGFKLLSGELSAHVATGDAGGTITRHFCPVCGSGIYNEPEILPDVVVVRGGTLDDPSAFPPTRELFARSRPDWVEITTIKQSFSGAPG
jgi:hypothetical protein